MEFSPFNSIVKLCLQGMQLEQEAKPAEAAAVFMQAWNEATNDFEKFLAAYYLPRHQQTTTDKLKWLETTLHYALATDDAGVTTALPRLYAAIADCYNGLGNAGKANEYILLADAAKNNPADKGPFYHGTKAHLQPGDLLTPGGNSNYKADLIMNHIYFTAMVNGAGLAAALAKGDAQERVYMVQPTGSFENDPNVTDKKFPGNPTRSYRSDAPLKIIEEVTNWTRYPDEEIAKFKERLANTNGEIIN